MQFRHSLSTHLQVLDKFVSGISPEVKLTLCSQVVVGPRLFLHLYLTIACHSQVPHGAAAVLILIR